MKIQLSDHFTYKKLLHFTFPSVAMMIFTSIYGVVDGFFVSNFTGKTAFAAVNFIMPLLLVLDAVSFMFGAGGNALVSKTMGEGDYKKANSTFSLVTYVSVIIGVIIAALGILFIRPIAALLGAEGQLLDDCVIYAQIVLAVKPFCMLQIEFQSFFVTAEKPQLGLISTIVAGVTNILLDVLMVVVFRWGIVGAAVATALSQFAGGLFPLVYFFRPNSSLLRLTKTKYDGNALARVCINGASELLSNASMSLVGILYNIQLMQFAGEDGVAAYGVLMYVNMIFIGAFLGYSVGTAPIIGFHYGAQNHKELKNLLHKSLIIMSISSVAMFVLGELLAKPLSWVFVSYDPALYELTLRGFKLFSYSFLFVGVAILGSGFFTALNNGAVSATISFMRTLVFQVAAILILPIFLGIDGIWLSVVVAELMAMILSLVFFAIMQKKYQY